MPPLLRPDWRPMVRLLHIGLIAFGGALGAGARWGVVEGIGFAGATMSILALNVVGSALVGCLAGAGFAPSPDRRHPIWPFVAIGFAGALTTFSTFALQIAENLEASDVAAGLGITATTTILALLAVTAGFGVGRRLGRA